MKGFTCLRSNFPIDREKEYLFAKELSATAEEKIISHTSKKFSLVQCISKKEDYCLKDNKRDIYVMIHGYIVNEKELIELYLSPVNQNYTTSSIISNLYQIYGESFVNFLKGSFSLILIDSANDILIGAKDHMSMKPLYYFNCSRNIILSTLQSSIYKNFSETSQLNHKRIDEYLNGVLQKSDHTFFNNIFSIPRGSYLIFKDSQLEIKKYFNFDTETTIELQNDQEYAECTREKFLNTLNKYIAKFPVYASKLSGGLDSSSICCGIKYLYPESDFKCINVDYDHLSAEELKASDEKYFVDNVVKHSMLNLHKHKIKPGDYPTIKLLRDIYEQSDIVIPGFNQGFQISFFEFLSDTSTNVLFDGFDGDSAISFGKEKFVLLQREGKLIQLFNERRLYAKHHNLKLSNKSNLKKTLLSLFKDHEQGNAHKLHSEIFNHYGWDYSLEYTQNHANYFGIEEVYPFFDRDLMQHFISLPVDQKLNKGRSRYNFRESMKGIIPESVRNRYTKGILSKMWIHEVSKVNLDELEQIFLKTEISRFFDGSKIIDDIKLLNSSKNIKNKSGFANKIFQHISLALWLEKYE